MRCEGWHTRTSANFALYRQLAMTSAASKTTAGHFNGQSLQQHHQHVGAHLQHAFGSIYSFASTASFQV